MKRTKIVCTIGPASETKSQIKKMVKAGMNVARLNFSHGTYKNHTILINNVRSIAKQEKQNVAIIQDLQGPRIRIGEVSAEGIKIKKGQDIVLYPENIPAPKSKGLIAIPIQYKELYKDVKKGHLILIDDAKNELKIELIKNKAIYCKVIIGDVIKTHKGMNFPNSFISTPPITTKDKQDLAFGVSKGVDFIALSFVKGASDIVNLRKLIAEQEKKLGKKPIVVGNPKRVGDISTTHTRIIAKIERNEAVENFEEILEVVDGIMVARGDLGLEIPIEKLPMIQKNIIRRCLQETKPVIVATQMLDSMIEYPMPTRAEISDVANAVLDGTDAIMLSGETASGKYPVRAVETMRKIADSLEAQEILEHEVIEDSLTQAVDDITETVSHSVQDIAEDVGAKVIVCATTSGFTARAIAKYRPVVPIIAITPDKMVENQMSITWGVKSYNLSFTKSLADLDAKIMKFLKKEKIIKTGDIIVLTGSHPFGQINQTNLIKVEKI